MQASTLTRLNVQIDSDLYWQLKKLSKARQQKLGPLVEEAISGLLSKEDEERAA